MDAVFNPLITDDLPLRGLWVLLIEERPDVKELLKLVIEAMGAEVITVSPGDEALKVLDYFVFNALVGDTRVLEERNSAIIFQVRKLEAEVGKQIPIVAVTVVETVNAGQETEEFQSPPAQPIGLEELIAVVTDLVQINCKRYPNA